MIMRWLESWKRDKLYGSMIICWLLTVFSSFFNSYLLPVPVPGVGTMFLFRFMLPITLLLYIIWAFRNKVNPWKDSSALEKWCYVFIAVMLGYGAVSLLWVEDFSFSFRLLFNLCFDMGFFFLILRLLKNKQLRDLTASLCTVMLGLLIILGIYDVFFGVVGNDIYAEKEVFLWFHTLYRYPVVFESNTNDFSAMLCFVLGFIFLNELAPGKKVSLWKTILLAVLTSGTLLLVNASSARLCQVALFAEIIGFIIYILFSRYKIKLALGVLLIGILFVEFGCNYEKVVLPVQQYVKQMMAYWEDQQRYDQYMQTMPSTGGLSETQNTDSSGDTQPSDTQGTIPSAPVETEASIPDETKPSIPIETDPSVPVETEPSIPSEDTHPSVPEENTTPSIPTQTQTPTQPPVKPTQPTLGLDDYDIKDEFVKVDEETGDVSLKKYTSAAIRVKLLLHAWDCFKNSKFLGAGIGTTQALAAQRTDLMGISAIHCFIARIIADYGIFIMVPLFAIMFLLLKSAFLAIWNGFKKRRPLHWAYGILYLMVLISYPFASTAPSDAQDRLSMWMFLGFLVYLTSVLNALKTEQD